MASKSPATNPPEHASGRVPLATQIAEMLERDILSGVLPDGERLPPERTMAQQLKISVGTLRKALAHLESRELLVRVQGSGNFVRNNPDIDNIYALFRLQHIDGPVSPTADLLSLKRMQKNTASLAAHLPAHRAASHAFRFRRLRYLGMANAAIEEIWLDGRFAEQIDANAIGDSLYRFYRDALDCRITRVEDRVSVARLPAWTPRHFHSHKNECWGFVERLSRDQHGLVAEFSRTWFNPEKVRFVVR